MNFIESYHYLLLGISLLAIPGLINAKSLSEQIEELQKTSNYSSPFDVDTLITHHHPSQNGNSDGDAESSTVVYRDNVDTSDLSPNIAHSGSSSTTHYYPSSTSTSRPNSLDSMVKPNIDIDSSNPVNNGREDPLQKILPKVRFNCSGRPESYYADPDFNCEVFHYCKTNGFRFTFVCPPRSQFNQKHMTCDYDKPGDALCSKPSNESLTSTDNYSNQSPASIDSELITVLGSTERPFTPITPSASPTPSYSSPEWPNSGPSTVSSDKHDSAYGFEPLEHGQPYGHFPSLGSTDEEDFNRGNSHEVQETSKKTSFADPPSDIENSYKSSPKPNHDIVSVSTESIPDIAVSSGSPKSRIPIGYSSPMPDIDETSNKDSSGGFKPVFMDKGSGSGGPRKYSTVAPPILEIEAADNSGKVDLPSSMTTGSPFSVGPAYSTSLTPSYSPSTPVFSTSFSSPSTSSSSPSSSPPSASFSPSTTTPMPATSATPIQQSTISSPPRSKYHSLDDGNDLKPLTKITVQPIDLNYLNSNRNLKPKATSNSQRTSQRQPPSTSSNTYFSRPITSKVKDDYNNNKVTSNGKGNGNQNNLHNVKSRVNKPTKYSTYSLFNDIRSDSRNSLTNGKTSHHASKSSFEPILGLTQFGQYTPSYLENIDRGAYPLNFNRSRPLVLSGQSSASSVATAASTPAISSAFLESQAAKFAQIAKLNLEKSNSHRDPFAFDYTALSQTDLPIFHPVYDQFHPGGQRSTLATVNSQLQEKFVSEKEQLFKKLRQQYAQDQIRKQLHQSLTDHVQQQGQQQQSNTLTGANLFANSGKPLTSLGSAPVMAASASTPLQQMTQSTSLIPSVTLEEEEAKYPDYFYGLPKLSALSQPSSMAPGKSNSIPKFDGNLLHSVANGQNTGSQFSTFNNPFVSESNDANKKQPIEPYRLPIGKRPANPVQATSSSSLVSSLQRLPWFNSKNSPVAPDNIATSASNNDQSVSFASLFDQTAASSATNAQTSRRIPFFSQITKFFSSASFPRPSNLFPQITAKSSTNFPFSYDQLSSSPMNSPSGYSNLFSNGHNPGHNYGQFGRSPVNNDQSSFPGSMNINRQMINRRHFSPSWEESFASSSMLEPIVAPDRRSSNGPVTFESRGPKPYFSIELGKDGWSSSVPLNGHFHSSQKNEQAKYNSDPKHNLYYIQPTHHHDHQKRSSRRKRSLRLTKPEYRYSMPHSNPSYSLFLRLFNNIRPNSLTFLTNPNKLVFGGPGGGHNFASASTLGATYLSPRFAPSLPNFSQSPYLGTTLRPVFTRQYDTSGYGHLPFASVNSPAFSPFTSGTSLGLGPHHSHYGLNLDSPFSSSSLSYEEDLKHRLLAQPKFLQTYDRPNLKSSSGFYENTDFNPLSIDLNELNEYESPPIYEAYSKKNSKEYDSNKEYYYRPVSLTKGNSKRPPKREKVPGHLQHSSSIEPQHSSRHHSIDDTSYSDASHSSSSSPSVHMDDEAYYKGDPNPNSYEHGPEGPAYMDKEREPEIYEDVGPSPARDPARGPEGNVDDRDRSHDGYVNNPHHQSSYDYHSDGKKYDHYTSIDHYPEDGYDEGSSSGSMVRGHHDASIDYGALVPPYAKDLPSDPDSKSMGGVNYSTISQVYRPSLQVHQHRIHHVTSSPAQEYSGSNYYTPNEQHYVKHETGGNYESMNGKDSSPYQNGNINHNDANTYSNGPSMNQPIINQNNNNNFKLEVIEDDYDNSPQSPVRSNKDATKVKAESQNNEEQSKNYGYSPQSNIKYPYDYENTKIFINHGGGDHGRPYIGEAAYNEYPDSGYGDSDYANGKNYYPEPEQVNTPTTNQNTNSNINNNNNNDNNNNKNNANNSDDNKSGGNKNDKERDKVGQKKISPYDKKYHYNKPTITKITKEMKTSTPTMTEKPSSGQAPSSSYHSPSSKIHTSESTSTYPIATVTLRPTTSTALPSATARPQPTRTSGSAYSSAARNRNANMNHEEQQDNTEDGKTTERSVASKVSLFKKQRPEFTKLAYKYKPSAYQQSRREANKPGSSSPSPSSDSVASIPTPSTSTTTLKPDPRYTASSHYYHNSPVSSMVSTKSSLASQLATSTTTYRPTTARNHYTTQSSPSPSSPSSESSSVPTSLGDLDLASYGVRIFKGASGGVGTTKRPSVSVKASYSTVSSSSLPPVSAWKERKRDEQVKKQEQFKKQLIEQQRIRVHQLHQEASKTDSSSSSLISSSSSSSSSLISSSESKPSISTLVSSSSSTSTLKPIPRYSVSSYHNNPVNSVITLSSSSAPSPSPSTTQSSPKLTKSSKSLKSLKSIKLASTPGTTSTPSTSSTSSSTFSSTPTSVYQSTTSSRNNSNLNNHNHNINNSSNSNNNSLNHKNSNSNTNSGTNSR